MSSESFKEDFNEKSENLDFDENYSWLLRVYGFFIDFWVIYIAFVIIAILYVLVIDNIDRALITAILLLSIFIFNALLIPILLFISTHLTGFTPGKYLMGLKVINEDRMGKSSFLRFFKTKVVKFREVSGMNAFLYFVSIFAVLVALVGVYLSLINKPEYAIEDHFVLSIDQADPEYPSDEFRKTMRITVHNGDIYKVTYDHGIFKGTEYVKLEKVFGWWVVDEMVDKDGVSVESTIEVGEEIDLPEEDTNGQAQLIPQDSDTSPIFSTYNEDSSKHLELFVNGNSDTLLTVNGEQLPIDSSVASPAISTSGNTVCYSKYKSDGSVHRRSTGTLYCMNLATYQETILHEFGEGAIFSIGLNNRYLVYSLSTGEIGVIDLIDKTNHLLIVQEMFPESDPGFVLYIDDTSALVDPNDIEKLQNGNTRLIEIDLASSVPSLL